ncbi:MAG: hypothetical protein MSC31_09450 [Solirubrobacteraceae bacterium MAG38_C4-C5]|nr:hypothetical protein [Candidatus Siliceabacter maunaloa]
MDQVSRPLLVALAAVVLLAVAWLTVLRPGADAPADAGPVAPVVEAVDEAQQGAAASDAANAARQADPTEPAPGAVTPTDPSTPSAAPSAPGATGGVDPSLAAQMGEGSVEVLEQLERGRAVVLLFWNGRSSDDRAVRRAVSRVDRRDGDVRVIVERLEELGSYAAVTNDVRVESTPTTLVIAPDGAVQAVPGYTVTRELDQAVRDALAGEDDR